MPVTFVVREAAAGRVQLKFAGGWAHVGGAIIEGGCVPLPINLTNTPS